jgi:hypothetical protein
MPVGRTMLPKSDRRPRLDRVPLPVAGVALACLLGGAACDSIPLPALPGRAAATPDSTAAGSAARPARTEKTAAAVADPALAASRFDEVRRGLRRLVAAEESFYAENGVYTEDLGRIGFVPAGGTGVRFLWLSRDGWAASGTHPGVPGRDCVIYVGRMHPPPTTLKDVRSGREGVPVCDRLPAGRSAAVVAVRRPPPPSGPAAPASTLATPAPVPDPEPAPDTGSALDAVDPSVQMKVDLRNLVRSQDTYFGTQGVYARRTEPFALQYVWHRGVAITILSANDASWSARATSLRRPGKSCVIWLGPVAHRPATEAQKRVPDQPGTPACDD